MTPEQLRQYLEFYRDLGVGDIYRREVAQTSVGVKAEVELPPMAPASC
jgi:hypothetical protein